MEEYSKAEVDFMRQIGKGLQQLREQSKYDDPEMFALSIGMDYETYRKYERGINISIISLHRLLTHHEMSVPDFLNECKS